MVVYSDSRCLFAKEKKVFNPNAVLFSQLDLRPVITCPPRRLDQYAFLDLSSSTHRRRPGRATSYRPSHTVRSLPLNLSFLSRSKCPYTDTNTQSDLDQINEGIAEAQAAIAKILGARQADPATAAAASTATDASGNTSAGIGSTLGDISTLLSGLSDTLTGVCNLRDDISSLTSSLGL